MTVTTKRTRSNNSLRQCIPHCRAINSFIHSIPQGAGAASTEKAEVSEFARRLTSCDELTHAILNPLTDLTKQEEERLWRLREDIDLRLSG